MTKVDLSSYQNKHSKWDQFKRLLWTFVWVFFTFFLPRSLGNQFKLFLLKLFGAKLHKTAVVYSSVRIYAPWHLEMGEYSCLAPEVDCYNVDKIIIGNHSTVSQKSYLCAASHDITKSDNPLITAPINIKNQSWIGADSFIGMGVTIGSGAVVAACSVVVKDVESWSVVGGNPAKFIKKRIIND